MQDLNSPITLRTRKFITNRLLQRKQMVLDVIHPARPNVSRAELQEKLGELYKSPKEQVFVFGMRTHYGGGRSTGFALIYDSKEALERFEPKHRLVRVRILMCVRQLTFQNGLAPKIEKPSRKLRKERKKYVYLWSRIVLTIQPCQEGAWYQEEQDWRCQEEVRDFISLLGPLPILRQWLCTGQRVSAFVSSLYTLSF